MASTTRNVMKDYYFRTSTDETRPGFPGRSLSRLLSLCAATSSARAPTRQGWISPAAHCLVC
ncbi:hypothetical protein DL93DRAFT_2088749 [Clavulina sp. PMI_390]|nr:hypothetical protein DL93DRAFT_2088749 [Clavulina sp. PMI_390]